MTVLMLRTLAKNPERPDRVEGRVYDVPDAEAADLIAAQLAVKVTKPADKPATK